VVCLLLRRKGIWLFIPATIQFLEHMTSPSSVYIFRILLQCTTDSVWHGILLTSLVALLSFRVGGFIVNMSFLCSIQP
jgi:hypothetical protein